ncbi:MAG: hypothetical protein ACP5HC_02480 [Caldisericum sp.]
MVVRDEGFLKKVVNVVRGCATDFVPRKFGAILESLKKEGLDCFFTMVDGKRYAMWIIKGDFFLTGERTLEILLLEEAVEVDGCVLYRVKIRTGKKGEVLLI